MSAARRRRGHRECNIVDPWGLDSGNLRGVTHRLLRLRSNKNNPSQYRQAPKPEQMAVKSQNLVGPQVRRLRMTLGLSQGDLAAKLQVKGWDISRAGVSKIEARLRIVNDAEILLLASTLGREISELFPAKITDVK